VAAHFRFGFEVIDQGALAASRVSRRFACESAGEVERWLSVLRTEANSTGTGWLERLQPATMLRRDASKRRWFVMDREHNALHYYRDPTTAWRCPARPLGTLRLATRGRVAVALGHAGDSLSPADALQALMAMEGRPWALAVKGSLGEWHTLVAPDEASQTRWLQAIREPAGTVASVPEEDLLPEEKEPERRGSEGCEMLQRPSTPARSRAGSAASATSRSPSCDSLTREEAAAHPEEAGEKADRQASAGEGSPDTTTSTASGGSKREMGAQEPRQARSESCDTDNSPRSSVATSAANDTPGQQASEDVAAVGMASPIGMAPPLPFGEGAAPAQPGGCPPAVPKPPPLKLPLRLPLQPAPADGPETDEPAPVDRSGCSSTGDGQYGPSGAQAPRDVVPPLPQVLLSPPPPRLPGTVPGPRLSPGRGVPQPRQGPGPRSPAMKIASFEAPEFLPQAESPEADPAQAEPQEAAPAAEAPPPQVAAPESPGEPGTSSSSEVQSPPRLPIPVLNLQKLGSGGRAPEAPRLAPTGSPQRTRKRSSTLESVESDTNSESSTAESCSHTESVSESRDSRFESSADGFGQYEREAQPESARLPLVKRLERLKENATLAEIEVRSAVLQACTSASQTMRYFGQVPPAFDEDLKDIAAFANSLQHFLQAVNVLIREVVAAWKEIEQQQQARWRKGLGDMKFNTPRDWVPLSARGQRARRERVGLLSLD